MVDVRVELLVLGRGLQAARRWNLARWFPERATFANFEALVFRDLELRTYGTRGLEGFAWPPAGPAAAGRGAGAGAAGAGAAADGDRRAAAPPLPAGTPREALAAAAGAAAALEPSRAEFARRNVFSQVCGGHAGVLAQCVLVCALCVDGDWSLHVRDRDVDLPFDGLIYRYARPDAALAPPALLAAAGPAAPVRAAATEPGAGAGFVQCQLTSFLFARRGPHAGYVKRLLERHGYASADASADGWRFPRMTRWEDGFFENATGGFPALSSGNPNTRSTYQQQWGFLHCIDADHPHNAALVGLESEIFIDYPKEGAAAFYQIGSRQPGSWQLYRANGRVNLPIFPLGQLRREAYCPRGETANTRHIRNAEMEAWARLTATSALAEENGYLLSGDAPRGQAEVLIAGKNFNGFIAPDVVLEVIPVRPAFVRDLVAAGVPASGLCVRVPSLYDLMAHDAEVQSYFAPTDDLLQPDLGYLSGGGGAGVGAGHGAAANLNDPHMHLDRLNMNMNMNLNMDVNAALVGGGLPLEALLQALLLGERGASAAGHHEPGGRGPSGQAGVAAAAAAATGTPAGRDLSAGAGGGLRLAETPTTVPAAGRPARALFDSESEAGPGGSAASSAASFNALDQSYELLPNETPGAAFGAAGRAPSGLLGAGGPRAGVAAPAANLLGRGPAAAAHAGPVDWATAAPPAGGTGASSAPWGAAATAALAPALAARVRYLEAALARASDRADGYRGLYERTLDHYNRLSRHKLPREVIP